MSNTITLLGALPDRSRIPHAGEIGDCWAIHAWQDAWVIGPWDDGVTAFFGIECADVPEVP